MARHPGKTEEQIRALEPHLPSLDVENWIDTIATIEDVYNKNAEAATKGSGETQKALEKELDSIRLKLVAMRGMVALQKQYNDLLAIGKYTVANAMEQVKPWYEQLKPFFTPKGEAGVKKPPTPPVFIPTKILDALEYSTMEGYKAAWSETGSDELITETRDQTEILKDIKEAVQDITVY